MAAEADPNRDHRAHEDHEDDGHADGDEIAREIVRSEAGGPDAAVGPEAVDGDGASLDDISRELLALSGMLLDEHGMDEAVANVLGVAVRTLGPDCAVSLTVSQPDDPERAFTTRDATTDWARELDEWQYEHDEGPCLLADQTGRPVYVEDRDDPRFPNFCEVAGDHGVCETVSYPLLVEDRSLGSINVFYTRHGALGEVAQATGLELALASAPVLANWLAHIRVVTLAEQLEEALVARGTIERAKGLLMGELGVDDQQAFDLLRTQSQHENTKLREVAAQLLRQRAAGASQQVS